SNCRAMLLETFQGKLAGFMNRCQHLLPGLAHRSTTGEIRPVCPERCRPFFDDDQVTHRALLFLQSGLFQRAAKGSGRNINARLSRNRDGARLGRVVELLMAGFGSNLKPTASSLSSTA